MKGLGLWIGRWQSIEELLAERNIGRTAMFDIRLMSLLPEKSLAQFLKYLALSKSQSRQDLFVLAQLNFAKRGFFVEFGATNGISLSNTWLMETEFQWTGILAEPAKCWHADLRNNRTAKIETNCIWSKSHEQFEFRETDVPELSTLQDFSKNDRHSSKRMRGSSYTVNTISLNDLLEKHNAPEVIDYLSIDTEGSEFVILNSVDFNRFKFKVITVEHNFTNAREQIFNLLTSKGYRRVLEEVSGFDDWYIHDSIA